MKDLETLCKERMKAGEAKYDTCWQEVQYIPECIEEIVDALNYIRGAAEKSNFTSYKFQCYSIEDRLKNIFYDLTKMK